MIDLKNLVCRRKYLPAGEHEVVLASIDLAPSLFGDGKESLEFMFTNNDGEAVVRTGTTIRPPHALHDLAQKLLGIAVKPGDEVDLASCINRKYRIAVVVSKTGAITVDKVVPIETEEDFLGRLSQMPS